MDFEALKNALFAEAKAKGLTEYEVFAKTSSGLSAEMLGHELQSVTSGTAGGICFRCAVNGRLGAASTQSTEKADVLALVARAMANAAVIDADEEPVFFEGSPAYEKKTCEPVPAPDTGELRRAVADISARVFAADARVSESSSMGAGAGYVTVSLANSKGLFLSNEMGSRHSYAEAILKTEHESVNAFVVSQDLTGKDPDIAVKAVNKAASKLGAGTVKTGTYDVIFAADQVRSLLSAFGGAFSGKAALEGLSRLAGKEETQVAASMLTLVDDPFYPENPMQTPFDAEGVATYKKNLIENGVLKTLLYDLTTAKKAGKTTTGNASRPSYASNVSIEAYCILVGTNTALLDNPGLKTTRWPGRNPIRILLDRHHRVADDSKIFSDGAQTIVYREQTDWPFVVQDLAKRSIHSVLVEGGAQVLNHIIASGIYDEIDVEVSPIVIGDGVPAPKVELTNGRLCDGHWCYTIRHEAN